MKSIKQQYIDLREGRMSQANFMRNLRMTMPQYITNITSFNDSVKILKNKGILSEMLDPTQAEEIAKTAGSYKAAVDKLEDMGLDFDKADDIATGIYGDYDEEAEEAERINMMIDQERENQFDESKSLREAKDEKTKWTNTSGKSMYDQFSEINNLNAQEVLIGIDYEREKNPELTKAAAAKIVVKNLKKNPIYYTSTLMAGKEGYEPEYIGGKSANAEARQMQYLDKNMGNVVDKKMGMQPVKGIEKFKKDSDKATAEKYKTSGISLMSLVAKSTRGVKKMDATGEKMKKVAMNEVSMNDAPGETPGKIAQQIDTHINENPILQQYSDEIVLQSNPDGFLKFGYWKELPADALTALELKFNVKKDTDFDPDTGRIVFYRLTPNMDIDKNKVAKTIFDKNALAIKNTTKIGKGEEIEKRGEKKDKKLTKDDLMEMIREELREITGAYGGDDMGGEDGSSYINKEQY